MARFREKALSQGFSKTAVDILIKSWRPNTRKVYSYFIEKYISFCKIEGVNMFEPRIEDGINFLSLIFQSGVSYNRLCLARAALSSFLVLKNQKFGEHPLVARFMKGAFEEKPVFKWETKLPKWDANSVISFLETWQPNNQLTLKEVSYKLTFLLAILTGQRCQSLSLIKLNNLIFQEEKVTILFTDLLKHSRRKAQQAPIDILGFHDESLCVIRLLRIYIQLTKDLRGSEQRLLISFRKPYKAIGPETISRWIKHVLKASGINVNIKAHQTRGISTSLAKAAGIPIGEIMKAAGWAQQTTFNKFYKCYIKPFAGLMTGKKHSPKLVYKHYITLKSFLLRRARQISRKGNN